MYWAFEVGCFDLAIWRVQVLQREHHATIDRVCTSIHAKQLMRPGRLVQVSAEVPATKKQSISHLAIYHHMLCSATYTVPLISANNNSGSVGVALTIAAAPTRYRQVLAVHLQLNVPRGIIPSQEKCRCCTPHPTTYYCNFCRVHNMCGEKHPQHPY